MEPIGRLRFEFYDGGAVVTAEDKERLLSDVRNMNELEGGSAAMHA
jgi:hypothetical protein